MRWGIPCYRLPDDVLKHEIDRIFRQGVQIYCNYPVTEDFLNEARDKYDAIFMGCGHGKSLKMNIPGEELTYDGLLFFIISEKSLKMLEIFKLLQ